MIIENIPTVYSESGLWITHPRVNTKEEAAGGGCMKRATLCVDISYTEEHQPKVEALRAAAKEVLSSADAVMRRAVEPTPLVLCVFDPADESRSLVIVRGSPVGFVSRMSVESDFSGSRLEFEIADGICDSVLQSGADEAAKRLEEVGAVVHRVRIDGDDLSSV